MTSDKKQAISIILSLSIIISVLCTGKVFDTYAYSYINYGDINYYVSGEKAILNGVSDSFSGGVVHIPSKIDGRPVSFGTYGGLFNDSSITSFVVDDDSEYLSNDSQGALYDKNKTILYRLPKATTITNFVIPKTVTTTDYLCCNGCKSLKKVSIPKSLNNVKAYDGFSGTTSYGPFLNCSNLREFVLDEESTSIPTQLFAGCTGLKEYVIPSNITSIGVRAFNGCINLEKLTLSDSIETIKAGAFAETKKLDTITIPKSIVNVYNYFSISGIGSGTIGPFQNSGLEYAIIEDGAEIIPDYIFYKATNLKNISMPKSIKTIEKYAFYECNSLNFIDFKKVETIGSYSFGNSGISELNLPSTIENIGECAFVYCKNLVNINLKNIYASFGKNCFAGCSSIESFTFPYYMTNIPSNFLLNCSSLKSISLYKSINSIESSAFSGCNSLSDVNYEGTLEDRNNIDIRTNNDPLEKAIWHYSLLIKPFSSDYDGWSIMNHKPPFGYSSDYKIPLSRYIDTFTSKKAATWLYRIKGSSWGGNCFGLSLTSLLHWCNKIDLKPLFSNSYSCLNQFGFETTKYDSLYPYRLNNGSKATNLVEKAQLLQFSEALDSCIVCEGTSSLSYLVEYVKNNNYRPLILGLEWHEWSGIQYVPSAHAVVVDTARSYFIDEEGFYHIPIYDCNFPHSEYDKEGTTAWGYNEEQYLIINLFTNQWRTNGTVSNWVSEGFGIYDIAGINKNILNEKQTRTSFWKTYLGVSGESCKITSNNKNLLSLQSGEYTSDVGEATIKSGIIQVGTNSDYNDFQVENASNSTIQIESEGYCISVFTDSSSPYTIENKNDLIIVNLDCKKSNNYDVILQSNKTDEIFTNVDIKGTVSEDGKLTFGLNNQNIIFLSSQSKNETALIDVISFSESGSTTTYSGEYKFSDIDGVNISNKPEINSHDELANVQINVANPTVLRYRTKLTIKATASNLDPAYHLILVVNGKEISGNNKEVSYDCGELKNDISYSVKIADTNGNIQKDANGVEYKIDGGKITCNAGFFQKIIAFFLKIFGLLPTKTVQPQSKS